jgi:alkylation response protein AidB-like acyl-CoA dehydrogenase
VSVSSELQPVTEIFGDQDTHGESPWLAIARELAEEFAETAVDRERHEVAPHAQLRQLRDTGLVNLLFRADLGGEGGTLADAVRVVAALSRGDASIGALLGFHYYASFVPRLFDFAGDAAALQRRSAEARWLWANVHQPRDGKFIARPTSDGGFVINGSKRWATGGPLADVTDVIAQRTDRKELLFAVIPTDRAGLRWHQDWDHLGLRLTATVSVDFEDVIVRPDEVIRSTHDGPQNTFPPLYTQFVLPLYSAVFIGSARAALDRARDYLRTRTRPRLASGGIPPIEDRLSHQLLGHHLAHLEVAEEFAYNTAERVWDAWGRRALLPREEVAELAVLASSARRIAAEAVLEAAPDVYELTGTWAAINSIGLDRHWRDARILSLHDSLSLSLTAAGDFYVNGTVPAFPPMAV